MFVYIDILGSARCLPDTGVCLLCSYTALHWASFSGHTDAAKALMAAGVDVHCTGNDGCGRDVALRGQLANASFAARTGDGGTALYKAARRPEALLQVHGA